VQSFYVRYGLLKKVRMAENRSTDWHPVRGDSCVVLVEGRRWWGQVLNPCRHDSEVFDSESDHVIYPVSAEELETKRVFAEHESALLAELVELASEFNQALRVLQVEQSLDGECLRIYYSCQEALSLRVITEQLLEEREISLDWVQIAARQRARLCGGVAVCGREFCCSTVLRELTPVTMRMARAQSRSLLPEETAGACGRLKCCLRYEFEDIGQVVLQAGATIRSRRVVGAVVSSAEPGRSVWVDDERGFRREVYLKEILELRGRDQGKTS
jgi:cell fate regulator YaaT (PSP1 superfamily)